MSETASFITNIFNKDQRLDKYLSEYMPKLSRARIQALIRSGQVMVNKHICLQPSAKLSENSKILVNIPPAEEAAPSAVDIPLNIIFEDADIVVLNKPAGLVAHPAPGHSNDTLVNALLYHCGGSLSGVGGVKRPGIVHRLDKDTSGLMVVAKNDMAHNNLSAQFSDRSLSRTYIAYVWGLPTPASGRINAPIGRHSVNRQMMAVTARGSKEALTNFKVLETYIPRNNLSMAISKVECKLMTGRTHQIRVHMTHAGHPLVGDPIYGRMPKGAAKFWPAEVIKFQRQALHATMLQLIHPATSEIMDFDCPAPTDLEELEQNIKETAGI